MDFTNPRRLSDRFRPKDHHRQSPSRRGPFCSAESCPVRLEIDVDDVQAEMVGLERVRLDEPPDQCAIERIRNKFADCVPSEYFYRWLRGLRRHP